MKLLDLFAEVNFKFDTMKVVEFTNLLKDLNISSLVGVTSLAGLGEAVKNLLTSADQTSTALLNLHAATALDPGRVQKFETFAQSMGAAAGSATSALEKLNQARFDVLMGKGNQTPFILTGISPTEETFTILEKIHKEFSDPSFLQKWAGNVGLVGKSYEELRAEFRKFIASGFGFSDDMLRTLMSTNEAWKTQASIIEFNQQEITKNAEAHRSWILATHDLNIEVEKLVTNLTPLLILITKVADQMVRFANTFTEGKRKIEDLVPLVSLFKLGALEVKAIGAGIQKNNEPITTEKNTNVTVHLSVNAEDAKTFGEKISEELKKHIRNADAQSAAYQI